MADTKITFDFEIKGKTSSMDIFVDPTKKAIGLSEALKAVSLSASKVDMAKLAKITGGGGITFQQFKHLTSMLSKKLGNSDDQLSKKVESNFTSGKSSQKYSVPVREKGFGRIKENPFNMEATEKYRAKLKQRTDEGINGIINAVSKMLKGVATDVAKVRTSSVVKSIVKETQVNRKANQLFGQDPSTMKSRWGTFETKVAVSKQNFGKEIGSMNPINQFQKDIIARHRQIYNAEISKINNEVGLLSQRGRFTNRAYNLALAEMRKAESISLKNIKLDIGNAEKINKQAVTSGNKQIAMAQATTNKTEGYYLALQKITEGAKNKISLNAISGKMDHSQAKELRGNVSVTADDAKLQLAGILNNKSLNAGQVKLAISALFSTVKNDIMLMTAQAHNDARRAGIGARGLVTSPLNISKKSLFTEHSAKITAEMTSQYLAKVRAIKTEREMAIRNGTLTEASAKAFQARIKALESTTSREINGAINMTRYLGSLGNKYEAIKVDTLKRETDNATKYRQRLANTIEAERSMLHMRTAKYSNIGAPHRAGIDKGLTSKENIFAIRLKGIQEMKLGEEKTKVAINQLFVELGHSIDRLKGDVSASSKVKMMHMLTSTANLRTVGGAMGAGALQMGSGLAQQVSSSHTKGQVAGAFRDLFTTAISASWYTAVSELGNIFGNMGDIIVESVMQPLRTLGSAVAGALKGIGTLAISAFMVSFTTIASAFGGPWAIAVTGSFAIVTIGVYALMQVLSDLMEFIKNILSSIKEIIFSVVKLALMTVVSLFKSFVSIIKGALEGMTLSFKEMFKVAMEVTKNAFEGIIKITKESVTEFAGLWEYAARSFKETIPNIGESAEAFAKSMIGLKSAFGFKKEDVGEAYFDTVSSGFRSLAQAEMMVTGASRLAIMSTSDLMTAQNALITVMQNYGPMGQTVEQTIQSLAAGATLGRFTMGELGTSLKSVIGIGSRTGMAFDDLMQSLSMMTKVFGRGSIEESTKYLGRFVEALAMPGRQGAKGLKELGIEFKGIGDKAPTFKDFIGLIAQMKNWSFESVRKVFTTIQSRRAWLALTQDVENYQKQIKESGEIKANLWRQEQEMMNTPLRQWAMLRESVNSLMILWGGSVWKVVGDAFKDVVAISKQLVQVFQGDKMTEFFSELVKYLQPMVDTVIVPIRNAFMSLFHLINRGTGSGNAWGKIFGGPIAQGIQHIIINIFRAIKSIPAVLSEAYNIIMKMFPALSGMGSSLGDVFKNMWKYLTTTDYITWIQDLVKNVLAGIETVYGILTDGTMWSSLWSNIMSGFSITLDTLRTLVLEFFPPIFTWILNSSMSLITTICSFLSKSLLAIMTGGEVSGEISSKLKNDFKNLLKGINTGDSNDPQRKQAKERIYEISQKVSAYRMYQGGSSNPVRKAELQGKIDMLGRERHKLENYLKNSEATSSPVGVASKSIIDAKDKILELFAKSGTAMSKAFIESNNKANGVNGIGSIVSKQIGTVLRNKDANFKDNEKHSGEVSYEARNEYDKAVTLDKAIKDQEEKVARSKGNFDRAELTDLKGGNATVDSERKSSVKLQLKDRMDTDQKRLDELNFERNGGVGQSIEELKKKADAEKLANLKPEIENMTDKQLAEESAQADKKVVTGQEKVKKTERNLKQGNIDDTKLGFMERAGTISRQKSMERIDFKNSATRSPEEMKEKERELDAKYKDKYKFGGGPEHNRKIDAERKEEMDTFKNRAKRSPEEMERFDKKLDAKYKARYDDNDHRRGGVVRKGVKGDLEKENQNAVNKLAYDTARKKKIDEEKQFRKEKGIVKPGTKEAEVSDVDQTVLNADDARRKSMSNIDMAQKEIDELKKTMPVNEGAQADRKKKISEKEQQLAGLKEKDKGIKAEQEKAQSIADQIATYKSLATNLENYFKSHATMVANTTLISTDLKGVMSGGGVSVSVGTSGTPSNIGVTI